LQNGGHDERVVRHLHVSLLRPAGRSVSLGVRFD
jgi:hypothetical protein